MTSIRKTIPSMEFSQGLVLFRMLSIGPIFSILLRDLVSSKLVVIPKIILTITWEEVLILTFTNKPKLLVCFHGISVYTRISWHILRIPGGKYVINLFSDVLLKGYESFICKSSFLHSSSWAIKKNVRLGSSLYNTLFRGIGNVNRTFRLHLRSFNWEWSHFPPGHNLRDSTIAPGRVERWVIRLKPSYICIMCTKLFLSF